MEKKDKKIESKVIDKKPESVKKEKSKKKYNFWYCLRLLNFQ